MLFRSIKQIPGNRYAELEMAITADKKPCDFNDNNAWVRGIGDLVIVNKDRAFYIDYKTGSNKYPDTDQLELMALLTFAHYPDIDKVNAALLFVVKESITKLTVRREDAEKLWWKYRERVAKIESSHSSGVWNQIGRAHV